MGPESTPSDSFVDAFMRLPPPLQGIAIFGIAIGFGAVLIRRFLKRTASEEPASKLYAAGVPAELTELDAVLDLVKTFDQVGLQLMKNEVAAAGMVQALGRIADIVGQIMADLHQEREEFERTPPRRKPRVRRTVAKKTSGG